MGASWLATTAKVAALMTRPTAVLMVLVNGWARHISLLMHSEGESI